MRGSMLATILGALGLAGVALLYAKVDRLEEQLAPRALQRTSVGADSPVARVAPAAGAASSRSEAHEGSFPPVRAGDEDSASDAGSGGRDAVAPDMATRVRELEAEVSRLRAERAAPGARFSARMPRFASSVDELASTLELSPTQTDRARDAVERHRRRIEDVLRIPDETGVSPWERRQQEQKRMRDALAESGAPGILQVAVGSLMDRNRPIPGRSTTYGEEIDRIKTEARSEIGDGLDPDQKKTFEELQIDPLLDQGNAPGFVGITVTAGSTSSGASPTRADEGTPAR